MSVENMSRREKDLLIEAVMYRITPDQRAFLMREAPSAYNAYCGSAIVQVVRTSDGLPI